MKKPLLLLMSLGLLVSSCTTKKATTTEKSPADIVAEVKKNYTDADMSAGKILWQENCNKCHKLHDGPEHDVAKWEKVLPRMSKRAKLTDEQAGKVRAYLLANAKM
jgi:cytochrome c5